MKIKDIQDDFNKRKDTKNLKAFFNGEALFFMLGDNALLDVPIEANDLNDLDWDAKMLEQQYHSVSGHDKLLILETVLHVLNTPKIELVGTKVYQVVYTWSDYSDYVENTVGIADNQDLAFKMACSVCNNVENEKHHIWEKDRVLVRSFYLNNYDPSHSRVEEHLYDISNRDDSRQIVIFKEDEGGDQFTITKEGQKFAHQ